MVLMAPVTRPIIIEGVTLHNPLPAAYFCDLNNECVIPIGGDIDPIDEKDLNKDLDDIHTSGVLPNGIHWGITNRNPDGFADILLDSPEVTEESIRQLIQLGIVTK
jgi:hypothetical protein